MKSAKQWMNEEGVPSQFPDQWGQENFANFILGIQIDALRHAAELCRAESLQEPSPSDDGYNSSDEGYMTAIEHCCGSIEAEANKLSQP